MNSQEAELEVLIDEIESEYSSKVPPIFELYTTVFSILMAIMMFLYPEMLNDGRMNAVKAYSNMMHVMSQPIWAMAFFGACMLKAIGLLLDSVWMRVSGLIASGLLYIALGVCFSIVFPNIGAITFSCMAIFTLISVPLVKHTTIRHKR